MGDSRHETKNFTTFVRVGCLSPHAIANLVQTKSKSNTSKSMSPSGVNLLNNWHRNDDKEEEEVVSTGTQTTNGQIGR